MILLFNHQPVSLPVKIQKLIDLAKSQYGSEFYNVQGNYWKGDQLTIESLFPSWILKEANTDSTVKIDILIKNYLRWLFSIEYGYGAQLEWNNIRCPVSINPIFLEALADYYFSGCDFSKDLNSVLPNIRKFAIKSDTNYFDRKGTPDAIKWVLTSLFGYSYDTTTVQTIASSILQIKVAGTIPTAYKTFLEYYVVPAGTNIQYVSI
jgi:hypothetical protein